MQIVFLGDKKIYEKLTKHLPEIKDALIYKQDKIMYILNTNIDVKNTDAIILDTITNEDILLLGIIIDRIIGKFKNNPVFVYDPESVIRENIIDLFKAYNIKIYEDLQLIIRELANIVDENKIYVTASKELLEILQVQGNY